MKKRTTIVLATLIMAVGCKTSKVPEIETPELISSNQMGSGQELQIEFKRGESHNHPLMAVWAEDLGGNYIQTLFVAKSLGTGIFEHGDPSTGKWLPGEIRRPAALPVWSHKRGVKELDGLYVPTTQTPVPDAYSGATPQKSFSLDTRLDKPGPEKFYIYFEINQTWDWNDYWHNNKYPDNDHYKASCQPSLVYRALVDMEDGIDNYTLQLVGRGHHAGENGEIYDDLETMTTALNIAREIKVNVIQ